jgi:hypothetical protein
VARLHFGKRKVAIPYKGSGPHYITTRDLKTRGIALFGFTCIWFYSAQNFRRDLDLILPLGPPEPAVVVSLARQTTRYGVGPTIAKVALSSGSLRTVECPPEYKLPLEQSVMARPTKPPIAYSLDECRALRAHKTNRVLPLLLMMTAAIAWLVYAFCRFAIDLRAHFSRTDLS